MSESRPSKFIIDGRPPFSREDLQAFGVGKAFVQISEAGQHWLGMFEDLELPKPSMAQRARNVLEALVSGVGVVAVMALFATLWLAPVLVHHFLGTGWAFASFTAWVPGVCWYVASKVVDAQLRAQVGIDELQRGTLCERVDAIEASLSALQRRVADAEKARGAQTGAEAAGRTGWL